MNTTQNTTDRNPLDLLTTAERADLLAQLDRLPKADKETLAATGMTMAWLVRAAEHTLAWRGAE